MKGKDIFYKKQLVFNVNKVMRFDEFIKIKYNNGDTQLFSYQDITFKEANQHNVTKDVIRYFKEIAKYVTGGNDEKEEFKSQETFLEREYNKISYVNQNSVLSYYINKKDLMKTVDIPDDIIFPFGFNISQKGAMENVYRSNISVINGPPGTGKTQTILNIISNLAIMQNKTVAVVSNNNEAVKNVRDKLKKNGYEFICASLGKKYNRELFFEHMPPICIDNFKSDYHETFLFSKLTELNHKLDKLLKTNNEKAELEREISNYKLEQQHFNHYYDSLDSKPIFFQTSNSEMILDLLLDLRVMHEKGLIIRWLYQIKLFQKYKIKNFKDIKNNFMDCILSLQRAFYVVKIRELENKYQQIVQELEEADFDDLQKRHEIFSRMLLKGRLYNRYCDMEKEDFHNLNYKKKFEKFLKRFPIVLSTTYSLQNSIPRDFMFDYVIIDEASQVDLLAGSLALSCAKNAIIVGDENQLPQIVDLKIKANLTNSEIDPCHDYFKNSILLAILKTYGEQVPNKTLKEHYRCHPKIIEFCNRRYYHNELIAFANEKHLKVEKPLVLYRTVPGNHMRKITHGKQRGTYNHRELDVIKEEVLNDKRIIKCKDEEIGITTPYRLQANMIAESLDSEVESDTIHKYQGREKLLMILSTVLDSSYQGRRGISFVDDPCMINVAVSRAIHQFVLVTDNKLFHEYGSEIKALIKYMKYNVLDAELIESNLVSVFDLLYQEYSKKLANLDNRLLKYSKFKSQNIINTILDEELRKDEYRDYSYIREEYLKNLFRNTDNLTESMRTYIKNGASVDFVVYDEMDRRPVLFIEVDGHAFHANNPKQLEKDELKNQIAISNNVEMVRFPTGDRYFSEENVRKIIREKLLKDKL